MFFKYFRHQWVRYVSPTLCFWALWKVGPFIHSFFIKCIGTKLLKVNRYLVFMECSAACAIKDINSILLEVRTIIDNLHFQFFKWLMLLYLNHISKFWVGNCTDVSIRTVVHIDSITMKGLLYCIQVFHTYFQINECENPHSCLYGTCIK